MTTRCARGHGNYGFCSAFGHMLRHLFYDVTDDNGISSLYVLCFYARIGDSSFKTDDRNFDGCRCFDQC